MSAIINKPSTVKIVHTGRASPRRLINAAVVFLILSLVIFIYQIINLNMHNAKASGLDSLPVSILAESEADYSRDPRNYGIPPISLNILNQIITDFPATGSPQDRMGTLQAVLLSPVPTMTPNPLLSAVFTSTLSSLTPQVNSPTAFTTPRSTASGSVSATSTVTHSYSTYTPPVSTSTKTPKPATKTSTPSFAFTSTLTQTLPATFTVTSSYTPTMTATLSLTNTFTPTPSQIPTSTNIASATASLTNTFTPTSTQISTATNIATASASPTNTPGAACGSITNSPITVSGPPSKELSTTITNGSGSAITLTSMSITNTETLNTITANAITIWNGSDSSPIKVIASWSGNSTFRDIAASGGTLPMIFIFQNPVSGLATEFDFNFDNGCILTAIYP